MYALDMLLNESSVLNTTEIMSEGFGKEYEPGMEGILEILGENAEDEYALESALMAVNIQKARCLCEGATAEAEVLQEKTMKNIFESIKTVVKKMWKRMVDFFNSVKLYFQKMFTGNKKFAETYKKEIEGMGSVEIEGYPINVDAPGVTTKNGWDAVKATYSSAYNEIIKSGDEKAIDAVKIPTTEEMKDAVAKKVAGGSASTFQKDLDKKLGKDGKKTTQTYSGAEAYKWLTSQNEVLNRIAQEKTDTDKAYAEAVSIIEKMQGRRKVTGEDDKTQTSNKAIAAAGKILDGYKAGLTMLNVIVGKRNGALKILCAQCKEAAYKGIAKGRKDKKESKTDTKPVSESFFNDIFDSLTK